MNMLAKRLQGEQDIKPPTKKLEEFKCNSRNLILENAKTGKEKSEKGKVKFLIRKYNLSKL